MGHDMVMLVELHLVKGQLTAKTKWLLNEIDHKNKIVILGDMFELGVESDKEHIELINFCLKNNFDDIFLIGNEFYKLLVQ